MKSIQSFKTVSIMAVLMTSSLALSAPALSSGSAGTTQQGPPYDGGGVRGPNAAVGDAHPTPTASPSPSPSVTMQK